tara:strand:+ start:1832 stop:2665 length:834 start_codon:yes stop_codon:yes gene_type:complete
MKVVVKLMGGLGNQMFQFAIGKKISLKYNKKLILDKTFLLRRDLDITYRNFDLNIFNIDNEIVEDFVVTNDYEILEEPLMSPNMTDNINIINNEKNIYVSGFFQKEYYFNDIRTQILKDFELTIQDDYIKKLESDILSSNSICINVRRGDYVTNQNTNNFHGFHGVEYINNSISEITKKIKTPMFYIFSDDIEWCVENLKINYPHFFVDHTYKGNKFSSYLKLMSSCKNFIIPNSTFAWWATWLNQNEQKIVYVPKNWLNVNYVNTDGLIPLSWNKL